MPLIDRTDRTQSFYRGLAFAHPAADVLAADVIGGHGIRVSPLDDIEFSISKFSCDVSHRLEILLGLGDRFGIIWASSGSHFLGFCEFGSRGQTPIIRTSWG